MKENKEDSDHGGISCNFYGGDSGADGTSPYVLIGQLAAAGIPFPAIYMACGTEDSLLEKSRAMADCLKSHGAEATFEIGQGAHEWDFWDAYILRALDWLPLEGKSAGVSSGNVGI